MNALLRKLSGGDLRSDGRANEVAEEVIRTPELLEQLLEGLDEPDDLVRARTVHVMERISRTNQGGIPRNHAATHQSIRERQDPDGQMALGHDIR